MMQRYNFWLFLVWMLFAPALQAQQETNYWYFGERAGMHFTGIAPSVLTNGAMNSFEPASAISDKKGRLLFYTDGSTVWNKNHVPMTNGTGLLGHESASQGALIVPQPGSESIYYIFTVDAIQNNLANGMRFHVVDMSLQNGLGQVVGKNTLLRNPVTEKLTAVRHANCRDVWIIAHEWNNNNFIAFLLSPTGLQTVAITSAVGRPHVSSGINPLGQARGCMKASPNGKSLGLAIFAPGGWVEILDFNNSTGVVSNPRVVPAGIMPPGDPYGAEFSPDGTQFYVSFPRGIFQTDISLQSGASTTQSTLTTGSLQLALDGKIYLAQDGGRFLGMVTEPNTSQGLVRPGGFIANAINLQGRLSRRSLPSFVQSNFLQTDSPYDIAFTTRSCNLSVDFSTLFITPFPPDFVRWDFDDPASGVNNQSTLQKPTHLFTSEGTFRVTLTAGTNGGCAYTVNKDITLRGAISEAGSDKILCNGDSALLGSQPRTGYTYRWSPATSLNDPTLSQPMFYGVNTSSTPVDYTYVLIATDNQNACRATDTVKIRVNPAVKAMAGADQTICSANATTQTVQLGTPGVSFYTYKWSPATGLNNTAIANPTVAIINNSDTVRRYTYFLEVSDLNTRCSGKDTVVVTVSPAPKADAGADRKLCANAAPFTIGSAPMADYTYSWTPAAGLSDATIANPLLTLWAPQSASDTVRNYIVSANFAGCTAKDTVRIRIYPLPSVSGITGEVLFCPFSSNVYEVAAVPGYSYQWIAEGGTIADGQGTASIRVNWLGTNAKARVRVVPTSEFGCRRDTFSLPVIIASQQKLPKPQGSEQICYSDRNNQSYRIAGREGDLYTWQARGGRIVSGQGSATVRVSWDAVGSAQLWVSGRNNNPVEACISNSDTLKINLLLSPDTTAVIQGTALICEGSRNVPYRISGFAGSTFAWEIDDKAVAGQSADNLKTDWLTPGVHTIRVTETTKDKCVGKPVTLSVTVNPLPVTVLNIPAAIVCPQQLNGFVYTARGYKGSVYEWSVQGGTIVSGQGTDTVRVNWDTTTPKSIGVQETSGQGCTGLRIEKSVSYDNSAISMWVTTVDPANSSSVKINWQLSNSTLSNAEVMVWRRAAGTQAFQLLTRLPKVTTSYTDANVNTGTTVYEYRVQTLNACGDTLASLVHNSLLLKGQKTEVPRDAAQGNIRLEWNHYRNWQNGVQRYEIWRKLDGESAFTYYATANSPNTVLQNVTDGFVHCYKIKAIEQGGNQQEAWSQEICLEFEHPLFVPNVITPNNDGKNDTWEVVNIGLYKQSRVEIFNRYGQKVYSSDNYQNDWNAPGHSSGVYYYRITTVQRSQEFKGALQVLK